MRFLPLLLLAPVSSAQEEVLHADLLDNGDFAEQLEVAVSDSRSRAVPWWVTSTPLERTWEEDAWWLVTPEGTSARQPFAGYVPLAEQLILRGRVRGSGVVVLEDGAGGLARFEVADSAFELNGAQITAALGRPPQPRFMLHLAGSAGGAAWTDVQALVALPRADPADLRVEVIERLDAIFELWFERALEPGPGDTGLVHHLFDAVTGERLATVPGGLFPLWDELLRALEEHPDPEWSARLETFLDAYLERCLHPQTGLPCSWDLAAGRRVVDGWVEPHAALRTLLDVAERGPERHRAPALAAARRMGETILEAGVLPDGNVAAKYRPRDAAVTLDALPLRRLDTPAQLARLGAATGDPRFVEVARNALAEFEFTHHWPGNWEHIDPGFDDDFGTYGGRAVIMLGAYPDDPTFRGLVRSGHDYFAPRWRDALRFGGTIAADQVRCWRLLLEYARHDPDALDELRTLVPAAMRQHVKGTQYKNGAWGDVTAAHFDPKTGIQVGDLPGTPSNLLQGIALCHDPRLDLDLAEVRAVYRAVLRSTEERYGREYGYLLTEREQAGQNMAGGGMRLLNGLTAMLRRLDE